MQKTYIHGLYSNIKELLHLIIVIIFMFFSSLTLADVYEKIDESGLTIYSDSPLDNQYVLIIQETTDIQLSAEKTTGLNLIEINTSIVNASISTPTELLQQIEKASITHQVDPDLIHAVIHVESAYRQQAKSVKGAIGLMQLIPATAKRMGVSDIYDSAQNINGGTKYLSQLLHLFDNDIQLALAAYNAGENSVLKYGKKIPPFKETQAYVPKVMRVYEALRKQRAKT